MPLSARINFQVIVLAALGAVACTVNGTRIDVRIDRTSAGQKVDSTSVPVSATRGPGLTGVITSPTQTPASVANPISTPAPTPPPPPSFIVKIDGAPPYLEMPYAATIGSQGTISGDYPDRHTFKAMATKLVGQDVVATRDILFWSVESHNGWDASSYVFVPGTNSLTDIATDTFTLVTRATSSMVPRVTLGVKASSGSICAGRVTVVVGMGWTPFEFF